MLCGNDEMRGATRWKSHNGARAERDVWESPMMRLQFETVDVFTADQFSGNPLAVVLNAEGLSTQQMQAIAAEFNLAETTFVLPPKNNAHTAEVRIFTPRAEMPFAGHPNVGTAYVLARAGTSYGRAIPQDRVIFEEKAGLVPITLLKDGPAISGARLASPQPLAVGYQVPVEAVASACGIAAEDIETRNHPPCIASCGVGFILAEVKNRAALASAMPHIDVFRRDIVNRGTTGILIYTRSMTTTSTYARACSRR
jgi:trans-2,3-dihydro-3-hydroxyanthranilate isomerase